MQPWRRLGESGPVVARKVLKTEADEQENDEEMMELKTVGTEISQIVRTFGEIEESDSNRGEEVQKNWLLNDT